MKNSIEAHDFTRKYGKSLSAFSDEELRQMNIAGLRLELKVLLEPKKIRKEPIDRFILRLRAYDAL